MKSSKKPGPKSRPAQKKTRAAAPVNPPGPGRGNPATDRRFASEPLDGATAPQLEVLVRTAVFKSANELVGLLAPAGGRAHRRRLPAQARRSAQGPGNHRGAGDFWPLSFARAITTITRARKQGHYPADDALGLEVSYTPALAKLICLEGADEPTYLKAERHLEQTGGIAVSARQIQRVVQRVGRQRPSLAGARSPARPVRRARSCTSAPTAPACRWCRRS